jgi:hypothetical protein
LKRADDMPRTRIVRVLRILAEAQQPMSTMDLAATGGEQFRDRHAAACAYMNALRTLEADGRVVRAGRTPGGRRQGPAVLWQITGCGRAWLGTVEQAAAGALAQANTIQQEKAWREAVTAWMAEQYASGVPLRKIAAATGLDPVTVRNRCGIPVQDGPGIQPGTPQGDRYAARRAERERQRAAGPYAGSNQDRSATAAARDVDLARRAVQARPVDCPDTWWVVVEARVTYPDLSWSQLAAQIGMSKHKATGVWRRFTTQYAGAL